MKPCSSYNIKHINSSTSLSHSLHLSLSLRPPGPRRYIADPPHPFLKSFCTLFSLPSLLPSPSPLRHITGKKHWLPFLFFFLPLHAHLFTLSPSPQPPPVHPPVPPFLRLLTLLRSAPLALLPPLFNVPTHPSAHPQAYITTSEAPSTPSSLFIPAVIYSLFSLSLYHFIIQLNPPLSTFTSFHSSSITHLPTFTHTHLSTASTCVVSPTLPPSPDLSSTPPSSPSSNFSLSGSSDHPCGEDY